MDRDYGQTLRIAESVVTLKTAPAVLVATSDQEDQSDEGKRVLTVASHYPANELETSDDENNVSPVTDDKADVHVENAESLKSADAAAEVELSDGDQTEYTDSSGEAKNDSSAGFFSLENILRTVIQPVLEEFNNGKTEDVKRTEEELHVSEDPEPMPMLQIEAPVVTENLTQDLQTQTPQNESAEAEVEKAGKKLKFQCHGKNITENDTAVVKIVNGTELLNMISFKTNESRSDCVLVMFYAPWCHFSAHTAPHFNALGRAYPNLDVLAVDAIYFSNLNARFGTVSVPNILLFHQSRAVVKFNQTTRSFNNFIQFVKNLTGLEPNASVILEEQDYEGPLPSVPTVETDYLLWLAWLFVCVCSTYMFTVSSTGQHIINRVNVLWQEHQHIE